MREVVNHLIYPKAPPERGFVVIIEPTQVARPRFNSIHSKMDNKIKNSEIPKSGCEDQEYSKSKKGMNSSVHS